MASAYGKIETSSRPVLNYLPLTVKNSKEKFGLDNVVVLDYAREQDLAECRALLNLEIERGQTYPHEQVLDEVGFKAYFLSHDAFVLRKLIADGTTSELMGCFYIKPNFPGRCSHTCNGGFLVHDNYRGRGIGKYLGRAFQSMARDLGYKNSLFNLVFETNVASVKLWRSLGFVNSGRVPRAGRLKGIDRLVDALQFFCNLDEVKHETIDI